MRVKVRKICLVAIALLSVVILTRLIYEWRLFNIDKFTFGFDQSENENTLIYEGLADQEEMSVKEIQMYLKEIGIDDRAIAQMTEQELREYASAKLIQVSTNYLQIDNRGEISGVQSSDINDADEDMYIKKNDFLFRTYEDKYTVITEITVSVLPYWKMKYEIAVGAYMSSINDSVKCFYCCYDTKKQESVHYELSSKSEAVTNNMYLGWRLVDTVETRNKENWMFHMQYDFSLLYEREPELISSFEGRQVFLQ